MNSHCSNQDRFLNLVFIAKHHFNEPLIKDSIYLLISNILNMGFGFIFWIIAARFYSIKDIGLAASLISVLGLVILFSRFGFDVSIIRFFKYQDIAKIINTSLIITSLASTIVAIGLVLFALNHVGVLNYLKNPLTAVLFILTCLFNSCAFLTGNFFNAARRGNHFLVQNLFLSSRIFLLIPFAIFGYIGIFGSIGIAYFLASVFSLYITRNYISIKNLKIDSNFLRDSLNFSFWNYISNILFSAPVFILPLLVMNMLGEIEAAKFYIAFAIANIVMVIPTTISTSLLVDGSHQQGEKFEKNILKTAIYTFAILIPPVLILIFHGDLVLEAINSDYMGAFDLLKIFSISSFFVAIYSVFIPLQNIRMKVENIACINFLRFSLLILLSYILVLKYGISGVGYAWLICYAILDLILVILNINDVRMFIAEKC
jgi:O-antigen/teichoic acid export membrane protein